MRCGLAGKVRQGKAWRGKAWQGRCGKVCLGEVR
nr:MAG TPA: hypothetical protein [Caudoviricetes sp.]